jgi:hypothetical protein
MKTKTKRKLAFLAGFVLYFGVLWFFWESAVVYPLKIFVVLLHEVSHAIALWATGGSVESITLDPRQGGATYGRGGSRILTLSAGYLGSLLWGVLLVMSAYARRMSAQWIVFGVGALVAILTVVYVRSPFGIVFGLLFGAALLASGHGLQELWNRRVLLILGLTSCLYAILDIKSDILDRPELRSDAAMLAEVTGIPTLVWGVLWIIVAVGVSAALFRWAWKRA